MSKKIICASCGAEYEEKLRRCPFCGTATLAADEKEYMGKLEDVRRDLEEAGSKGGKELKRSLGKTVVIVAAVMAAIAALIAGSIWLSGASERHEGQQKKEEFLKNQGITTGMLEDSAYDM